MIPRRPPWEQWPTSRHHMAVCRRLTVCMACTLLLIPQHTHRSEQLSQRCAAEVFSTLRVFTDFLLAFFLECLRYVTFHLIHKLCCGIVVVLSDSLLKPSTTECFNVLLWPLASCLWHTGRALKLCLGPCLEILASLVSQCVLVVRAFRLVEVNTRPRPSQPQHHTI